MKFLVKNKKELKKLFPKIIKQIRQGNRIFLLIGELGAGKTTFVKKFAKYLGIKELISSPTFVLWQKYMIKNKEKGKFLNHLDLYRIKDIKDILKIGLRKELKSKNDIFFVEWGEKLENYLKKSKLKYKKIFINKINKNSRLIEII